MFTTGKGRRLRNVAIYSAVALLLVVLNMVDGLVRTRMLSQQEAESRLEETARLEADAVDNYVDDLLCRARAGSAAFGAVSQLVSPQSEAMIEDRLSQVEAVSLFIVTPDEEIHYTQDRYFDALNQMDFSEGLTGKDTVSGVQYLNGQTDAGFVVIAVPIWKEMTVAGLLGGVYPTVILEQALRLSCFNGQAHTHLIQQDGQFIVRAAQTGTSGGGRSLSEAELCFSKGYSLEQTLTMMQQGQAGVVRFSTDDRKERYAYLTPSGTNGWYILLVVPTEVLYARTDDFLRVGLQMMVKNMAILGIYFAAVLYYREQSSRQTKQMLKDLTQAHARLLASEERFKLAASHSNGLILEHRRGEEKGRILSYNETGGQVLPERGDLESLNWEGIIHPDDYGQSRMMHRQILDGRKSVKEVIRLKSREVPEESCRRENCSRWSCDGTDCQERAYAGHVCTNVLPSDGRDRPASSGSTPSGSCPGRYRWYQMTITALENGEDDAILITLEDIDLRYQEREALEMLARQDSLTGLLNRAASEQSVTARLERMEKGERAGFLLMDLDDFKSVNDRLGHVMGDQVLREFAQQLRRQFRESDPMGRLGGDEFMVFVANLSDPDVIRQKTQELNQAVDRWSARMQWEDRSLFSISVGVAFAQAGDSFQLLYRRADAALYHSKSQGKRRCSFYTESPSPAGKN